MKICYHDALLSKANKAASNYIQNYTLYIFNWPTRNNGIKVATLNYIALNVIPRIA
jgi:hypothetical protein